MNWFDEWLDFNGDGKISWDEMALATIIMHECMKEEEEDKDEDLDDIFGNYYSSDKYSNDLDNDADENLDDFCDNDDIDADLDDFEDDDETDDISDDLEDDDVNEDYNDKEAIFGQLEEVVNDIKNLLSSASLSVEISSDDKKEKTENLLVEDDACMIPVAKYLSVDGHFLYAKAIKCNFSLPCFLPDENEGREMDLCEIIEKIARYDETLSLDVWSWCLKQFLPYAEYDRGCREDLSTNVIYNFYRFPKNYMTSLVCYMNKNHEFFEAFISTIDEAKSDISKIIAEAIKQNSHDIAKSLFKLGLEKSGNGWRKIKNFVDCVITCCKTPRESESIEYFRDNLLPMVKEISDEMIQDEIPEWENQIAEYLGEINETKYAWRRYYKKEDGLDPACFETYAEYWAARNAKIMEAKRQRREEYAKDKNIYTYCGVILSPEHSPYSFRTEDETLQIGDTVIVEVGENRKKMKGTVVSIGKYSRLGVPYPVEKTKFILGKANDE